MVLKSKLISRAMFALSMLLCVTVLNSPADEPGTALLRQDSFWRCRFASGTECARLNSGELVPVHPSQFSEKGIREIDGRRKRVYLMRKHEQAVYEPLPPSDWTSPDFDDSSWIRLRGPFTDGRKHIYKSRPLMCLRGRFTVYDPDRVGDITLSVSFFGGVLVYINGKELTRAYMPEGGIKPATPAKDYPADIYTEAEGKLVINRKTSPEKLKARVRHIRDVTVPVSSLRKGINVLAVEIHRPPTPEIFFTYIFKGHGPGYTKSFSWWSRIGLVALELKAGPGAPVVPNAGHHNASPGLQVWNRPIYNPAHSSDYGDPNDPLQPVSLCTGRNGVTSGQVVIDSDTAVKNPGAEVSVLKGPGIIPSSAVNVRWALPDGNVYRGYPPLFDGLEESPPAEVPVLKWARRGGGSRAVQPVWITVQVPPEAEPGEYTGTVVLSADSRTSAEVPLTLHVVDWRVPDPREFFTFLGLIQSPESVAMYYKVPLWSEKHWNLLDQTFRLLGTVGAKAVYITAQRKTHFGNEHAMIRFREENGKLTPDLSIAERYVKLAVKHLGKIPVVCIYCWRPAWSRGNFLPGRKEGKDLPISLSIEEKNGTLKKAEGPKWGAPECVQLWKPVVTGMKKILAGHGMADSLMIGIIGDVWPSDAALKDIREASGGLKWVMHSHTIMTRLGLGYSAKAWGGGGHWGHPDFGRGYGWKTPPSPFRTMTRQSPGPLPKERLVLEGLVTRVGVKPKIGHFTGLHGRGRMGADFWSVLGKENRRGRGSLAERYTETGWGQLSLRCCGLSILSPGKDGAISTARLEMFRENLQEIEARIFIEKALTDPVQKAKLGEELADRAQKLLDQRTRLAIRAGAGELETVLVSDIQGLSCKLYITAAEVAKALRDT